MTDKEMVRMVARSDGFHRKPRHYREEVKKRFNREVTSATVCKAIGPYDTRLKLPEKVLLDKARSLLLSCQFDKGLACAMVGKAAVS